jgi:hypothetical protein
MSDVVHTVQLPAKFRVFIYLATAELDTIDSRTSPQAVPTTLRAAYGPPD